MTNNYWTITDPANITTSELVQQAKELFGNVYIYDENNLDVQFPAPKTDIVVSFLKSYEPDEKHLNKSYDDFIVEKDKTYMNFRQYLILAMFVWKTEQKHLDEIGWTRTSSLWSDGVLVSGRWRPSDSGLCCDGGLRDFRLAGNGPREVRYLHNLELNKLTITMRTKKEMLDYLYSDEVSFRDFPMTADFIKVEILADIRDILAQLIPPKKESEE